MRSSDVNTPGILNCNELKEFWVSWLNGRLSTGYGGIPLIREIIAFEDTTPTAVNYMAISTGFNSIGEWIFYGIPGEDLA